MGKLEKFPPRGGDKKPYEKPAIVRTEQVDKRGEVEKPTFNEEEFLNFCSQTFIEMQVAREGLLERAIKSVEQEIGRGDINEYVEEYLDHENIEKTIENLKEKDVSWILNELHGGLDDSITDAMLKGAGKSGEEFQHKLWNVEGADDIQEILDTLHEQYGLTLGPVEDWFVTDSIGTIRTVAVWLKYTTGKDPLPIAKHAFIKYIAAEYVGQNEELPPRIKLLLSAEEIQEIRKRFETTDEKVERKKKDLEKLNDEFKKDDEEKEGALRKTGAHEKFVEKTERERKQGQADYLFGVAGSVQRARKKAIQRMDEYLQKVADPRTLLDVLFDVQNTQLGRKLKGGS